MNTNLFTQFVHMFFVYASAGSLHKRLIRKYIHTEIISWQTQGTSTAAHLPIKVTYTLNEGGDSFSSYQTKVHFRNII